MYIPSKMRVVPAALVSALCSSRAAGVVRRADAAGLRGGSRSLQTDNKVAVQAEESSELDTLEAIEYEPIEIDYNSCTGEPGAGPSYNATVVQADLDAARAKWGDRQDYDFSFRQSCFCHFTSFAFPYNVAVRNGLVESVVDSDGLQVPCEFGYEPTVSITVDENGTVVETINSVPQCTQDQLQGLARVIEKQFDYIQQAIDGQYCQLTVKYDAVLGYPTSIQTKYGGPYLADDGMGYANGNLVPYLDDGPDFLGDKADGPTKTLCSDYGADCNSCLTSPIEMGCKFCAGKCTDDCPMDIAVFGTFGTEKQDAAGDVCRAVEETETANAECASRVNKHGEQDCRSCVSQNPKDKRKGRRQGRRFECTWYEGMKSCAATCETMGDCGAQITGNDVGECPFEEPAPDLLLLEPDMIACTKDVKLCPDGTYVGRDHNNGCDYFSCPTPEVLAESPKCKTDQDCRPEVFSYHCGGCNCEAYHVDEAIRMTCPEGMPAVECFADPCATPSQHTAVCSEGKCKAVIVEKGPSKGKKINHEKAKRDEEAKRKPKKLERKANKKV